MSLVETVIGSVLGDAQPDGVMSRCPGGGLGGLLSRFQRAGLGYVAESWIGNGPNQPVSRLQLQNVFGDDQVYDMAGETGLQPGAFLSQLSRHLPNAVNRMTPNGRLDDVFASS